MPSIEAGPIVSNLRQLVEQKTHCQCIRCREVKGGYKSKNKIVLDRIDYDASKRKEIFLQYIDEGSKKLLALLRLRIPSSYAPPPFQGCCTRMNERSREGVLYKKIPALKNSALIREVHTYGKMAGIDQRDKKSPQQEVR